MRPETRYARSGDFNVAYHVIGEGPLDLVMVPGFVSNIDWYWEDPGLARMMRRFASFSRFIVFDKRGTGLSDRVPVDKLPTLEERMDDVRAVMDAVASKRAALFGYSEGGPMCTLFAATYPERTAALVMYGAYARRLRADDYPYGLPREALEDRIEACLRQWGGPVLLETWAPSMANDERFRSWWATNLRLGASPSAAVAIIKMTMDIDIRHVLPTVRIPTLIIHRVGDSLIDVGNSRYMAQHIPDAKYVELPGVDHLLWVGDTDTVVDEIQEFLTGVRRESEPDRVLMTVLFTDIVNSTECAARLGDSRWGDLLERFYARARREIGGFRGREIRVEGDSIFAAFDGPARAIRCACAIHHAVEELGIRLRTGLHTGECEIMGEKLEGIAVHTGARVAEFAAPGEVFVSSTVKDLVAGSGLCFADRGSHRLKGIPGEWRLFAVKR